MKDQQSKNSLLTDLQDSKQDQQKMQPEETILDLPGVEDIPGQEHIHPPKMSEFVDSTISSDDEEGKGILDFEDDELLDEDSQVTTEEKRLLAKAAGNRIAGEDQLLVDAAVDNIDEDGEKLNETNEVSGIDLDTPGSDEDDDDEELGEEDEENNNYSLGGDKD